MHLGFLCGQTATIERLLSVDLRTTGCWRKVSALSFAGLPFLASAMTRILCRFLSSSCFVCRDQPSSAACCPFRPFPVGDVLLLKSQLLLGLCLGSDCLHCLFLCIDHICCLPQNLQVVRKRRECFKVKMVGQNTVEIICSSHFVQQQHLRRLPEGLVGPKNWKNPPKARTKL